MVGYQVRFTDTSGDATMIKVMTDGILLAELHRDPQLLRYEVLIIDEAHERSLNIDFILGYLKQLLPRLPDLKVIITSATIDPDRFSDHFAGGESKQSAGGESTSRAPEANQTSRAPEANQQAERRRRTHKAERRRRIKQAERRRRISGRVDAPVIEVSGRTYPVEVRYRPVADPDRPDAEPRDQVQAISDAVDELRAEGPGDILVFLSGEREIRDTADALSGQARPGGAAALRPAVGG